VRQRRTDALAAHRRGSRPVRGVAGLEALKGILVLLAGTALLRLGPRSAQLIGEDLVRHFHLNPAREMPGVFVAVIGGLTDRRLQWIAVGAAGYALVRFVEAYGLWRGYRWAQLCGVVLGAAYIPLELLELWRQVTGAGLALLAANVSIVAILWGASRRERPAL